MAEIKSRIRVKRCTNTSLSSHLEDTLPAGAPLYNTDTGELFVGKNDKLEDKRAVTSGELRYKNVRVVPTTSSSGKNRVNVEGDSEINIVGENVSNLLIRHISPSSGSSNSGIEITTDDNAIRTSAGGINIGIGPTTAQANCITIGTKIGQNSPDSKNSSIAIGSGKTQALGNNSIAIGNEITANKDNQVVLGNYDFSKIFENDFITSKIATSLKNIGTIDNLYATGDTDILFNGIYIDLGNVTVSNKTGRVRLTILTGNKKNSSTGAYDQPIWPSNNPETSVSFSIPTNEIYRHAMVSRNTTGISTSSTSSEVDWNSGSGYSIDIDNKTSTVTIHPNHSIGTPTLLILGVVS